MTDSQRIAFIEEIAPYAQEAYKTLGKVKPSVCIGMACVESGYGGSKLMYSHHSVLGQKVGTGRTAKKYWSGKFFTSKTKEEYTVGVHTVITSAFRAYDDLRQCIFNYYELLNTSLYKKVKADADYRTQMRQIKECEYMTSSTEVNSVLSCIKKYNLTKYDGPPIEENNLPVLKRGSTGEYVKAWQRYLLTCGIDIGKYGADGIYGKDTEYAVLLYQKRKHLPETGIIDDDDWNSVGK